MNPNPAKLFIGNLPFKTTREELMQHFAGAGTVVDATILVDKFTGRSRGFGFVEMSSAEEATKAKEMFNGKDFGGRNLIVNDARPEQPREGGMQMQPSDVQPTEQAPSDMEPQE